MSESRIKSMIVKELYKNISKKFKGKHLSPETEFKKGHIPVNKGKKMPQISGEKNGHWKGGRFINKNGYILIWNSNKRKYIFEHRIIMEKHLKRKLTKNDFIHHINHNPSDNRIENLKLFLSNSEHAHYHHPKGSRIGKNLINV